MGYIRRSHHFCERAWSYAPSAWVFSAFFLLTLLVYHSTLFDIPRSDHITVFSIFKDLSLPDDITQIAFMEFFGDPRFQPLAWFLHFVEIKAFGLNFFLYHLAIVALHALNGMLVYRLVRSITGKHLLSFLAGLLFVTLFTHLPMVAWPLAFYSPLSVSLSLLAVLSLLKSHRESKPVFLYAAYGIAFVSLFLYEVNVILPIVIFVLSLALGWSSTNRRMLIARNVPLMLGVYIIFAGLYLTLMPRYAGMPEQIATIDNLQTALTAAPIEFFNTIFGHNVFATSQVIIDELVFAVPFTAKSFSLTTAEPLLAKLNIAVYLAILALIITARRPYKARAVWIWILAAWAFLYVMLIFFDRGVPYVLSQTRHAYFPAIALIVILVLFYERYFAKGWSWSNTRSASFAGRYGAIVFVVVVLFFSGLNTAKVMRNLDDYMAYREYTNSIYYTASDWLSEQDDYSNRLFLSMTTYPPHEKLAWGSDIVPDLFLDDPRITKRFDEATHILEWNDGDPAPTIRKTNRPPAMALALAADESTPIPGVADEAIEDIRDDFAITFGMMTHPARVEEDYLEVFGSPTDSDSTYQQRRWWLRLYFDQSATLGIGEAGKARVVLGYSDVPSSYIADGWVFASQPILIRQSRMTHFVLVRENGAFGLIVNGELVEKAKVVSGVDTRNMNLGLGEVYRMAYRKPYYFAHTFLEFGRSSYSIQNKDPGYVFESIQFNPMGFQEYHMTLTL